MKTRKTACCVTLLLVMIVSFLAYWWLASSASSNASEMTIVFALATVTFFVGAFSGLTASFFFDE